MKKYLEEYYKTMKKSNNLSKKDIIKKINNIKLIKTQYNNKELNNNRNKNSTNKLLNLRKKNLTCTNLYDYDYNYRDITERKIKNPLIKLKKDLMLNTSYSSFISKNSKSKNSQLLITGLDSVNKNKNKIKDIISYSDIKTRTNSSKNEKTNNINNNSLFIKTDIMMYPKNTKIYMKDFYYDIYNTENLKEDVPAFLEKTRIMRKEKFKNFILDNIYYSKKSIYEEQFKLIQIQKDEYFKNLNCLNIFEKSLNRYLGHLEKEKNKENQKLIQLNKRKKNLTAINYKLQKQINKLNFEITKYQNIKKFLVSAKYGSDAINNKEKNNELSLFLTETSNIKVENNKKELFSESIIPKLTMTEKSKTNKLFLRQNTINLKDINKLNFNQKDNNSIKKEKKIRKIYSTSITKNKSPRLDNDYEFNLFTNFENSIINSIYCLNEQRKSINELNIKLSQTKNDFESEYVNNHITISNKKMKLYILELENKDLKSKYESIRKNTLLKESFKNNLEKKIYNILLNFNEEINLEEKLGIRDLFQFLKLKSDEFFEKKNIGKLIYMIKIIELIDSFLNNIKDTYMRDPKLKEKYESAVNFVEKDKYLRKIKINREQLQKNLERRKLNIIKKSNQTRFFSYKKYDVKYHQNNKSHFIKKENNKNISIINYEEWLTYNSPKKYRKK